VTRGTRPPANRPTSFTLLGLYLGWKAAAGFLLALGLNLDPSSDGVSGGLPLLTAVFAAVAAEALWRCRPWCARATAGYFCAAILASLAASAAAGELTAGEEVFFSFLTKGIFSAIPVLYVRMRAAQLFAPQPARVPVPAARP
jgi:hypothetical protein